MTNEDVPPDVHDVLWTAYRDAGGNMDAGAVTLAREVVRLRERVERARELVSSDALAITYQTLGQYRTALLAALGWDDE